METAIRTRVSLLLSLALQFVFLIPSLAIANTNRLESLHGVATAHQNETAQLGDRPMVIGEPSVGSGSTAGPVKNRQTASQFVGVWNLVSVNRLTIPPKATAFITKSTMELRFDSNSYNCFTKADWTFEGDGVVITTTDASCKGDFIGDKDRGVFILRGDRLEFASSTYMRSWIFYRADEKLWDIDEVTEAEAKEQSGKPAVITLPVIKPIEKNKVVKKTTPAKANEKKIKKEKPIVKQKESIATFDDGMIAYNKKKYSKAINIWKILAETGDARSGYHLGYMYYKGTFVTQDYRKAVRWIKQSAQKDFYKAQYLLALMYDTGRGVAKSSQLATSWRLKGDMNAAKDGVKLSQAALGDRYFYGHGIGKNDALALKWYHKAAKQGNAKSQYMVGNLYAQGIGAPKNEEEAAKWYRKAAKQNYAKAQTALGAMYIGGKGVTPNIDMAIKWLDKAEKNKNAEASYWLGSLHEQGKGFPKNLDTAKKYYKKAADEGFLPARRLLKKLTLKKVEDTGATKIKDETAPITNKEESTKLAMATLIPPESPMTGNRPKFRWKAVTGAVTYDVWVADPDGKRVSISISADNGCGGGLMCQMLWMNRLSNGSYKLMVVARAASKSSNSTWMNLTVAGSQIEIVEAKQPKHKRAVPVPQSSQLPFDLPMDIDIDELMKMGSIAMLIPVAISGLLFLVMIISGWKMFAKANVPGILSLIPFINLIFLVKIAGKPIWWFILLLIPVVGIVVWIIINIGVAKNFGKGAGFGIGLLLLPIIFVPILGFGKARYEG